MTTETPAAGFAQRLMAAEPHASLGRHAETYGRLIGSWAGEYTDRLEDGTVERGRMEVHFAWVLDGRAVQDVWIAPSIDQRRRQPGGRRDTWGSTLRVFDPASETWRLIWLNPPKGVRNDLIGRRVGDEIVHTGWYRDRPIRWVFTRITPDSFGWHASELEPDGTTWRLVTEFDLKRTR